ncbi:hypothetical protein A2W24_00480 [Microgenomates group bacterium RBG_16_45_19]|nr:MAG: hypothetical protein A2W24_00480 [Microgenomates group bacterium RBG_16_45_19]
MSGCGAETKEVLRYEDFGPTIRDRDTRTWGLQVLIYDRRSDTIFVWADPDTENRGEVHVFEGKVFLKDMGLKGLNSVSGGKKENENWRQVGLREMGKELGIEGLGELTVLEDLPLFTSFQQRVIDNKLQGSVLATVVGVYEPTEEERLRLRGKGEFIEREKLLAMAGNDESGVLRPAFKMALLMSEFYKPESQAGLEMLVSDYNLMILSGVIAHCGQEDIPLTMGVFSRHYG